MKLWSNEKKSVRGKLNGDIIQLVSCPVNGNVCSQNLAEINSLLSTAQQSRFSKEYGLTIVKMKEALAIADGIESERCMNCAKLFRNTILNSMDSVKDELGQMSKGIFHSSYRNSYQELKVMLDELRDNKLV